jgi:hypothetical protein
MSWYEFIQKVPRGQEIGCPERLTKSTKCRGEHIRAVSTLPWSGPITAFMWNDLYHDFVSTLRGWLFPRDLSALPRARPDRDRR